MTAIINKIVFVMGVSGSGKSSVGRLLAKELSIPYVEGDDHHPQSNVDKMSKGIALNDADRLPWLDKLHSIASMHLDKGCVIACSALKQSYRDRLMLAIESHVEWIYLEGSYELIYKRMQQRENHFMDANMLRSQFDTLELPKKANFISIEDSLEAIVGKIISQT